jgi:hypothetical protein
VALTRSAINTCEKKEGILGPIKVVLPEFYGSVVCGRSLAEIDFINQVFLVSSPPNLQI